MTCKHEYELKRGDAYLYESCEPNDTVNVTITCVHCGHQKTMTLGVNDDYVGEWD